MQWAIDLVGPMQATTRGRGMMIVTTDYFTKWAEASNKTILDYLKKTLSNKKGKWPDELHGVLSAYHTTKRQTTCETSFSLAYGSEAIIHPNIVVPSISIVLPNFEQNEKQIATNLDLAEEKHEKVIIRITAYQQLLLSSYNKRAKI
ncbi:hypothetical protein ACFX11_018932 [Malus domestica]